MPKTLPPSVAAARNNELARQRAKKQTSPNLLWWSNAPWAPTGYGTQTNAVLPRIQAEGWNTGLAANFGLQGAMQTWNGMPVFPTGFQQYSQDVLFAQWQAFDGRHEGPTALLTLYDVWVIRNHHMGNIPVIASWVPVDHAPCPPAVVEYCRQDNVYPIAMSQFGQDMLTQQGVDAGYVPHSVDTDLFHPDKAKQGREAFGVDDRFIVMMTSANKGTLPNRKAFAEQMAAFAAFRKNHDDALLYMHTAIRGMGGIDLEHLMQAVGLTDEHVRFVDQFNYMNGMNAEVVASLMAAADVFLCASRGEGFGIPVVEAQAAGTRVIVNDWTAQPELVGDGWSTPGQLDWDHNQRAWYQTPFIGAIIESLEAAYEAGGGTSEKARDFALAYGHDRVFDEYWRPTLKVVADRLAAVGASGGSGPDGGEQ